MSPDEQARRMGQAWERLLSKPKHPVCFRVIEPDGKMHDFYLGAHAPELSDVEVNKIHQIWLQLTTRPGGERIHHKDVVTIALDLLEREVTGKEWQELMDHLVRDKKKDPASAEPRANL